MGIVETVFLVAIGMMARELFDIFRYERKIQRCTRVTLDPPQLNYDPQKDEAVLTINATRRAVKAAADWQKKGMRVDARVLHALLRQAVLIEQLNTRVIVV